MRALTEVAAGPRVFHKTSLSVSDLRHLLETTQPGKTDFERMV